VILLLDNYDSFVFNVARSFRELGVEVEVARSDALTVEEALSLEPTHLVISPGPRTPAEAGISVELVRAVDGRIPVLGICLGHQAVAVAYGGIIVAAREPLHGQAVQVLHEGVGIFSGLPRPFSAGLYHSLAVGGDALPEVLSVEARTASGEIMAVVHRTDPVWGLQFHPESVLTPDGQAIFANFLALPLPPGWGEGRRHLAVSSPGPT
jgi:anthranilate synthase/aminodeoxychorismate synthase-like glutamine amidotransferase